MENVSNKNTSKMQRCIISTGASSSSYLNNYFSNHVEENISICTCSCKEDICNIDTAGHYDIYISCSDKSSSEIIYDLFNFLIPRDVPIKVVLILDELISESSMPKYVAFLEKLAKHKFITLEIIDDSPLEPVTQEENIIYFVGPGNTGKTSIIASLSEIFRQNNQRLALIDITRKNKLINYFPRHSFLNSNNLKDFSLSRNFYSSVNIYTDGLVDLYVYDYQYDNKGPEVIYFCEILRKLSDLYDYIIVNADESSVFSTPYIFKTASKIFIVHDFMPTKIKTTKRLLLKLISAGIDTHKTVSLIYNKTLKDTIEIGKIEEKLLFIKLPGRKIMPTVDLDCNTYEIPFEQKTMTAMIKNLAANTTGIENTSKRYRNNILNIYKHINGIPYSDNDEMEISQYIKEKLQKLSDRKYIVENLLKKSRITAKSAGILNAGKEKFKSSGIGSSKLLISKIKNLKPSIKNRYNYLFSSLAKYKSIIYSKKQQ